MKHSHAPVFLFGAGAQKCGTSWLSEQLKRHPQFLMSPIKEIHYWDRRFHPEYFAPSNTACKISRQARKNPESLLRSPLIERQLMYRHEAFYKAFFESRLMPRHLAFGEFSPSYCILSAAELRYIRDFMRPYRMRILFLMRDPVTRFWSQCKMEFLKARNKGKDFDPHKAFIKRRSDPKFLRRGDYAAAIRNFDAAFGREELHLAFFEELFEPPALNAICSFIGIGTMEFDTSANPNEGLKLDRPPPRAWARVREVYGPVYRFVKDRMGYLPAAWT